MANIDDPKKFVERQFEEMTRKIAVALSSAKGVDVAYLSVASSELDKCRQSISKLDLTEESHATKHFGR